MVLTAFAVAVVFLALFVLVERRRRAPLIGFSLFANRIFTASAVVTVIGMFGYLGTAYAASIRLATVRGYSPLMTSIGFVCLNVMGWCCSRSAPNGHVQPFNPLKDVAFHALSSAYFIGYLVCGLAALV